jgi:hypothetical protein
MYNFGAFVKKCTKMEVIPMSVGINAQTWCFKNPEESCLARSAVRQFPANARTASHCAGLAHTWHRSCFIGADRFVLTRISVPSRRFRGGRAGTGQLDWAAAESAEFVNQEKRL